MSDEAYWQRQRLYRSRALGNGPNPFRGKVLDDVELAQALAYEQQATQADLSARARAGMLLANAGIGQAQLNASAAAMGSWKETMRTPTMVASMWKPRAPEYEPCDLCGGNMLGQVCWQPAPDVLYCSDCSRGPEKVPRERWWLRALRWLAKL